MTKKPENPPAFPAPMNPHPHGMELRDFFAGQVLQGMLANDYIQRKYAADLKALSKGLNLEPKPKAEAKHLQEWHALCAYQFADAMLEMRQRKNIND